MVSLTQSFPPHHGTQLQSASNRNWYYEEYVLGGKGGRCGWLTTLPPSCADCLEIWEFSLLEPSGPVQGVSFVPLV